MSQDGKRLYTDVIKCAPLHLLALEFYKRYNCFFDTRVNQNEYECACTTIKHKQECLCDYEYKSM